jgi:CRP-like cAMP-binding protein
VSTGKIKVSKIGPDGKESIVRIASAGDVIGHRSLFTNELYNATASALEDSHICFIDKQYIFKLIEKTPSVAINLIQNLSHDLGSAENKIASLSQKNVRERLAELLLSLKETFGVKEANRIRLDIKLTREEMASLIGVANETLIRFLTELKEENIIDQDGKTLYILDEEKLLEFANLSY